MEKIQILWISRFAPISTDPEGGSKTFNYYFRKIVEDNIFEVRLISSGKPAKRQDIETENAGIEKTILYWPSTKREKIKNIINIESKLNPFNRYVNLISNTEIIAVRNCLMRYKKDSYSPDIVILEWTNMVMLAGMVKDFFPDAKIIASEHDVTFVGYKRKSEYFSGLEKFKWKIKYQREKKFELKNLKLCDVILPHNADNKTVLIKEGIEKSKIQGLVPYYMNMASVNRKSNHRDILFFGAMSRPENSLSAKWFIDNVMPRLEDLDIRFVILGSNPPEDLKQLESEKVHITGFVESINPFFSQSMCLVASLVLGAGIKIKILEALSSGIPVLTNEIGIEGIPAMRNRDYFYCSEPEEYEYVIRKLYNLEYDEKKMELNAKTFINEHFSYDNFSATYRDILMNLGRTIR